MYTLIMIISEILGKKIQRDSKIDKTKPKDVYNYKNLPEVLY